MPVRGSTKNTANGGVVVDTVVSVNVPTGTKRGDVLVWWCQSDWTPVGQAKIPSGFRVVPPVRLAVRSGEIGDLVVGVRVATESEPASYSITTRAAYCGMVALSGVSLPGMRVGIGQRDTLSSSPFTLLTAAFRVEVPSEVLLVHHGNMGTTGNAQVGVVPSGYSKVEELTNGAYHYTLIGHRRFAHGYVPNPVSVVTNATKTASNLSFALAFPIVSQARRSAVANARQVLPAFRTLRPSIDLSSTGWGTV